MPQYMPPHFLQWCRLRTIVNPTLHNIQWLASLSGTHAWTTVHAMWFPPQYSEATALSERDSTIVGFDLLWLSLCPSCPFRFWPHVITRLLSVRTAAKLLPLDTYNRVERELRMELQLKRVTFLHIKTLYLFYPREYHQVKCHLFEGRASDSPGRHRVKVQ